MSLDRLFLTPPCDEVLEIIQHVGGIESFSRDILGFVKSAADGGDVKAQQILSVYYECLSENVDQDESESDLGRDAESECRRYCVLAAEQGDTASLYRLGTFYETGRFGLSEDMAAAFRCYAKAADQGSSAAQYRVGQCYENGIGVEPDFERAVYFYSLVVEKRFCKKSEESMYALARCFRDGKGIERDINKALELFRHTMLFDLDDSRLWCDLLDVTVKLKRYRHCNFCSGATKVVRSSSGPNWHSPAVFVVQLAGAGPSNNDNDAPKAPILLETISFDSHASMIEHQDLAYSGLRVALARGGSIHLFSVATFGFGCTLPSDDTRLHVNSIGFSSGPGHFLASKTTRTFNVWDTRRGPSDQCVLLRPKISGFKWAPVGAVIVVWTYEKCEFIDFDDENKRFVVKIPRVLDASWSGTGTRVALSTSYIGEREPRMTIFNLETNTIERVFKFPNLRWSLGGDKFILYHSLSAMGVVAVGNTATTPYQCELPKTVFRNERVLDVGASDQLGQLLLVLTGGLRVFTLNTELESAKFEQLTVFPGPFQSATLSPDLAFAAVYGDDEQVSLVSVAEQRVTRLFVVTSSSYYGLTSLEFQFSPDSAFLFVVWEHQILVWNTAGRPKCQLQQRNDALIKHFRIIPRSDSSTCSVFIRAEKKRNETMQLYSFDVGAVRKKYTDVEWNSLARQALTFLLCWRRHRAMGPTIAVIEDQVLRSVPPLIAQKIVDHLLFGPPLLSSLQTNSEVLPLFEFDDYSDEPSETSSLDFF